MGRKIGIRVNGIKIGEGDLGSASVILTEEIPMKGNLCALNLKVEEKTKTHSCMEYTTYIGVLELILKNQTLRSSSLTNANLNDPMEKERVGVSRFANRNFITCFCHLEHECIPFWMYYGGRKRRDKVLLRFPNFSSKIEECIHTDYAWTAEGKKCLFRNPLFQLMEDKFANQSEYDIGNYIESLLMFDIDYVPITSEIFTKENIQKADIDFSNISHCEDSVVEMKCYDTTVLGKQKSDPWDYEKETRIMSVLSLPYNRNWEYLDLRLKPEMFRDLKIILSPWSTQKRKEMVEGFLADSELPQEIKDTITIEFSALKGKLHFPTNR